MTKRESRVINAFINCVKNGEFTESYAITLIEDNQRYGWLSDAAKDVFYDAIGDESEQEPESVIAVETVTEPEPITEPEQEQSDTTTENEHKPLWED